MSSKMLAVRYLCFKASLIKDMMLKPRKKSFQGFLFIISVAIIYLCLEQHHIKQYPSIIPEDDRLFRYHLPASDSNNIIQSETITQPPKKEKENCYSFYDPNSSNGNWIFEWDSVFGLILQKHYGWRRCINNTQAIMIFTESYVSKQFENVIINSVGSTAGKCIGGAKDEQLICRRKFAESFGCDYNKLNIQPKQYNLMNLGECDQFLRDSIESSLYILKKSRISGSHGVSVFKGSQEFPYKSQCHIRRPYVVMEYISNPALMKGYKYDFRSYLLVASMDPVLLYYHDGFLRKNTVLYTNNVTDEAVHVTRVTHKRPLFNFTHFSSSLRDDMNLPENYLDSHIRPQLYSASRFLFESSRHSGWRKKKNIEQFHVFGIDWILDANGKVHLIEANMLPYIRPHREFNKPLEIWGEHGTYHFVHSFTETKPSGKRRWMEIDISGTKEYRK